MNIAFVNSTFGWGGVKTWYLQFAERLAKRGNHVFVYGRQPEFIDAAGFFRRGFESVSNPFFL